jgi:3-ketosteroid 9alpha-monooxygenase subunit A
MDGWYLVAFEGELENELNAAVIGDRRLILVRRGDELRAFDATCPHRGAHLGYGGRLTDDSIICPFHGYRVRLGRDGRGGFSVPEYAVARGGGMVFVRCSNDADNGWAAYLAQLEREHVIVNGFELRMRAPMTTIIENAFDRRHFDSVHGIRTDDFVVTATDEGALLVQSTFYVPTGRGPLDVEPADYRALVVSPGVAAVSLSGSLQYTVVTGATDLPGDRACAVRLSIAFPRAAWPGQPPAHVVEPLLEHSRRGLEEDRVMWENLAADVEPHWMPEDDASLTFFEFCARHGG